MLEDGGIIETTAIADARSKGAQPSPFGNSGPTPTHFGRSPGRSKEHHRPFQCNLSSMVCYLALSCSIRRVSLHLGASDLMVNRTDNGEGKSLLFSHRTASCMCSSLYESNRSTANTHLRVPTKIHNTGGAVVVPFRHTSTGPVQMVGILGKTRTFWVIEARHAAKHAYHFGVVCVSD